MNYQFIKKPTRDTVAMLQRRMGADSIETAIAYETIGLVEGKLIDMVVAADIAEKLARVIVEDIRGSCPQNFILIAVLGNTAAVEAAMRSIYKRLASKREGVLTW